LKLNYRVFFLPLFTRTSSGGAIYSKFSELTISNSVFDSNEASATGGAIYARAQLLTSTSNTFTNNKAPNGGAIVMYGIVDETSLSSTDDIFQD